jgi:hypothetical protein
MTTQETGAVTGTKDKNYNLIWYVEACLGNALRLETYIQDADREGDSEVADLFRKAQGTAARAPRWASSCCARGWPPDRSRSPLPPQALRRADRHNGRGAAVLDAADRCSLGRAIADNRIICPGLRGQPGSACAAGRGGPALASAGVSRP